jgi:hypothetical protein
MSHKCDACQKHQDNPLSGAYRFACLACCTRLVLSAYPSKPHAASMLAAIERFGGNPGRERILECVGQELTKRRSPGPKSTTA